MINKKMKDPIKDIEKILKQTNDFSEKRAETTFKKYPIFFSLFVTLGFVSVLHGIELIFNKIQFIQNNPYLLVIIGLIILISTGSIYKIVDRK